MKNLAICEEEAVIVHKIFDLYVCHGYGVHRIAGILNTEGIKSRAGKNWHHASVNGMIRNLTYTGILRSGKSQSPVIEELQIITSKTYEAAQTILKKRSKDSADNRPYPMNIQSCCLLNGKVYCADCSSRLVVTTNGRYYEENGERVKRLRYSCYGKTRKQTDCHGQTGYSSKRLDDVVDGIIRHIFNGMKSIPKSEVVHSGLASMQKEHESRLRVAQRDLAKAVDDLAELKAEVVNAIRGKSKFASDLLNELIIEAEKDMASITATRDEAKRELDGLKYQATELQSQYDELMSWTELYDTVDLSAKKMIIANLINRIEVGTDYEIHIDFNIDLSQFKIECDCCA
jgi:Recombinase.